MEHLDILYYVLGTYILEPSSIGCIAAVNQAKNTILTGLLGQPVMLVNNAETYEVCVWETKAQTRKKVFYHLKAHHWQSDESQQGSRQANKVRYVLQAKQLRFVF